MCSATSAKEHFEDIRETIYGHFSRSEQSLEPTPIPVLVIHFSPPQNDLIRRAPSASLVSGMASGSGHRRHRNGVTGYNFSECCKSALPKERERDELVDGVRGNQSTFPSSFGYFRVRLGRARVFFFFSCFENVSSFSPSRPDDDGARASRRSVHHFCRRCRFLPP